MFAERTYYFGLNDRRTQESMDRIQEENRIKVDLNNNLSPFPSLGSEMI